MLGCLLALGRAPGFSQPTNFGSFNPPHRHHARRLPLAVVEHLVPSDAHDAAEEVDRAAADPVRQAGPERGRCDAEDRGGHQGGETGGAGDVGRFVVVQVEQDEGDRDGVPRGLRDPQTEGAQDVAPVLPDHFQQPVLDDLA
ncbi:hypothetical protein GCM10023080_082590 [Streptomyces pseudoechinosporeus]